MLFALLLSFDATYADTNFLPLPASQAFVLKAQGAEDVVQLRWQMPVGYFLYKDRFTFKLLAPTDASLGRILYPAAQTKTTPYGQTMAVYKRSVSIAVPVLHEGDGHIRLEVGYQGCTDTGFCYPPQTHILALNIFDGTHSVTPNAKPMQPESETEHISTLLGSASTPLILLSFLGFGLLLSLTPCVLPMIPILSTILARFHDGKHTKAKHISLTVTYVLAMASTYAAAGSIAAIAGTNLQIALQNPWVLLPFAALFVVMALGLFDVYQLQAPQWLQDRYQPTSSDKPARFPHLRVAGMGILATLIVSPCVTPPLVGALGFISQTGDVLLGSSALFTMGLGMGAPLLTLGVLGQRFLPKAGQWMVTLKHFLGFTLIAVAISLISRLLSAAWTEILWGLLLLSVAVYWLYLPRPKPWLGRCLSMLIGLSLFSAGLYQTYVGVAPLITMTAVQQASKNAPPGFRLIKDLGALQYHIKNIDNRPTMVDFYADWCTSCHLIDTHVFHDHDVQQAFKNWQVLRVDITDNTLINRRILKHYKVIAPPTVLFFSGHGKPMPHQTLVGDFSREQLLRVLLHRPLLSQG